MSSHPSRGRAVSLSAMTMGNTNSLPHPTWVLEMAEEMWDNEFTYDLPKEIKRHITNIWDIDDDLLDDPMCWDPTDTDWIKDRGDLILCLWKLYHFWLLKGGSSNKIWYKKTGYLLGEVMWLLILYNGINETMFKIFHRKEKGHNRSDFNAIKAQLIITNGHYYVKLLQETHGSIITEHCDHIISLSPEWENLLTQNT